MFYDYKDAMVDYLPWYDKENEIIVNVCRSLELAFRDLDKKFDFVYSNLFLDTAVDMVPLFIKKLGLKVSEGASIKEKEFNPGLYALPSPANYGKDCGRDGGRDYQW